MEIKNLKKAADRLLSAIKSRERIIIYGDADLDGVSSVIILKETIESLGGSIKEVCFSDRENEGYGINEKALSRLKKYSPALIVVLDCGIGNFKEVKIAKKLGFEVIIVDHHEILGKIPDASIVVNPKQPGDKYPFKLFAAVGIVFRLSRLILGKKMTGALRKNFLELAAMATIADMMPRTEDNEEIIREGISSLPKSWRPGIQALLEVESFNSLTLIQEVEKMNSLLNIPDIKGGLPASYRLLTSGDIKEAESLVKNLFKKNLEKREKIREIVFFLEEKISEEKEKRVIFEGSPEWELILLGTVASIISQKYQKPVFLYKKGKRESPGSIRAPAGCNVVKSMENCSEYLITYGGHPQAAGFRIKNENLDKFRECLIKYFK